MPMVSDRHADYLSVLIGDEDQDQSAVSIGHRVGALGDPGSALLENRLSAAQSPSWRSGS
jgi:hypothetical protein